MERIWLQSYPPGVPADIPAVEGALGDLVERSARRHAGRSAFVCMGRALSYAEFDELTRCLGTYFQSLGLPKGTRIECVAHFDNSRNNAANPNPDTEVRWGDQSWEEMMIGWFDVAISPTMDPMDIYRPKPTSSNAPGGASRKPAE